MGDSSASSAEVQKELKGIDYPASKQDLLDHVRDSGKGKDVHDLLKQIPDKKYNSPVEVSKAIGDLK